MAAVTVNLKKTLWLQCCCWSGSRKRCLQEYISTCNYLLRYTIYIYNYICIYSYTIYIHYIYIYTSIIYEHFISVNMSRVPWASWCWSRGTVETRMVQQSRHWPPAAAGLKNRIGRSAGERARMRLHYSASDLDICFNIWRYRIYEDLNSFVVQWIQWIAIYQDFVHQCMNMCRTVHVNKSMSCENYNILCVCIYICLFWKTPVDIHIYIYISMMGFYRDVTNSRFSMIFFYHAEAAISTCHVMVFEHRWSAKLRVQANRMLHGHIFRSASLRDGLCKRKLTFHGILRGIFTFPSQSNPLSVWPRFPGFGLRFRSEQMKYSIVQPCNANMIPKNIPKPRLISRSLGICRISSWYLELVAGRRTLRLKQFKAPASPVTLRE